MAAYPLMCQMARHYDLRDFDAYLVCVAQLDLERLSPHFVSSIYIDLLYIYTLHRPNAEKAQALCERKDVARHMKLARPDSLRLRAAYHFFVLGQEDFGRSLLEQARQALEGQRDPAAYAVEREALDELAAKMGKGAEDAPRPFDRPAS